MNEESRPLTPKGLQTRDRLLAAARGLFAEHGYSGVRISDITGRAGLSSGAFYRYFDDRHQLMLELLRQLTDDAFDFIRAPEGSVDVVDSVVDSTRRYFEFYADNRALLGLMVELSQSDPEVKDLWAASRRAFYARIAGAMRRADDAGRLRAGLDLGVAAELLGSMTEFYAFQRFALADGVVTDVPLDHAARMLAETWLGGVLNTSNES